MGGEGIAACTGTPRGAQVGKSKIVVVIGPRDERSELRGRHEGKELEAKSDLILGYPSHGYLHLAMGGERDQ